MSNTPEFEAGQLVAYLKVLKQLEDMTKTHAPLSGEQLVLLNAQQRIGAMALEATQ